MAKKKKKTGAKAGKAGAAAALAARSYRFLRQVDWPLVWMRAKWLTEHSRRLYNNLSEAERKELLRLVTPTKSAGAVAKDDRARIVELVGKAFRGS